MLSFSRVVFCLCAVVLTPCAAGNRIAELRFADFFERPIGPRGLVMTGTLADTKDKCARIAGYVAREESPVQGRMLLASVPINLAELADGPADDLPPATLFVHGSSNQLVPPNREIVLVGRLSLGRQDESDGRVSWVRLDTSPDARCAE